MSKWKVFFIFIYCGNNWKRYSVLRRARYLLNCYGRNFRKSFEVFIVGAKRFLEWLE